MRIGIACGSDDTDLIPFFNRLYLNKMVDFIELYIFKDITVTQMHNWLNSGVPIPYLQAAHDGKANIDLESIASARIAHNFFRNERIVFDPGTVMSDYSLAGADNILIPENMPMKTSYGDGGVLCYPDDMPKYFCLDLSHAWITAEMLGVKPKLYLKKFFDKKPVHFHLTDTLDYEDHLPLGDGSVDLEYVFDRLPSNATVTIETDHDPRETREERIISDLLVAKKYENSSHSAGKSRF